MGRLLALWTVAVTLFPSLRATVAYIEEACSRTLSLDPLQNRAKVTRKAATVPMAAIIAGPTAKKEWSGSEAARETDVSALITAISKVSKSALIKLL